MTLTQHETLNQVIASDGLVLDRTGRVLGGGDYSLSALLALCSRGYLTGRHGRLIPTAAGRQAAAIGG